MKNSTIMAGLLVAGLMGLSSTPAAAQGTLNPQAQTGLAGSSCPTGWSNRGTRNMCYPGPGAKRAYPMPASGVIQCAEGYGNSNYWCLEGQRTMAEMSATKFSKTNPLDRCPVGFFTDPNNGRQCITELSSPPSVRAKGSAPCRTGEVEDWGIWCVSNYSSLRRDQANYGARDSNSIFLTSYYTTGSQQGTRQPNLPEGVEYSPAYITIFGRVKPDGSPMSGAEPARAAAAPAPTRTASAAPSDTRVGSMSPQRRSGSALGLCPSMWVQGQPGSDLPDANMCYPAPGAGAIFPVGAVEALCPEGYGNAVGWCVSGTPGVPASQSRQASAPANPNCPAPTQASAAGQALGGLLGGRRGNSQAGAALGGLLGQVAEGAARPAGC